jgi:hypothetical protein
MAMTVRLTEKEDAQLTQLAAIWGVSKQQAVTKAIEQTLGGLDHDQRVAAAIERTLDRYGDLLRRLGE